MLWGGRLLMGVAQGKCHGSCSGKVNLLWDGKIALGIKKQSGS
ncbi:MAG TPA: hypothetical protein PLB63_06700 [Planctomycetota bacterium]|nr:hypothetical protein [Planctomycetota bacterium]HQB00654.1 hypothetical protein [Planctomycetota bacterium]